MPLEGKATSGPTGELPPPGSHAAVLVALLVLGTFKEVFDRGTPKERTAELEKALLVFELTGLRQPGQAHGPVLSKDYNLAFSPKAGLRLMLEKMRGRPYSDGDDIDLRKMLNTAFLLTVTHEVSKNKGNAFAKVKDLSPVPKGLPVPPASIQPVVWEVATGLPYPEGDWVPTHLYGQAIKELIKEARESNLPAPGAQQPGHQQPPASPSATVDVPY
jgi:hypothetical protein